MGTPQKSCGRSLESPYAKFLPQYPSQSEGFMKNDFGGKPWGFPSTPSKQQYHQTQSNNYQQNSSQRRRGNNRYFNSNRGDSNAGNNARGGYRNNNHQDSYQNNYQNSYQNNYQNNSLQHTPKNSNNGNRQQPYHGQKFNKSEGNSRNDYYHPSMLVDPWKELLDRHNAIKNSQIDYAPAAMTAPEKHHSEESSHEKSTSEQRCSTTAIPSTETPATTTTAETSESISP